MKLDDSKLRDCLKSIYDGPLAAADAAAIIDVARFTASVDGRMDMSEMATVARLSKAVFGMSGEQDAPVPSTPIAAGALPDIGKRLATTGACELAYATARLVMLVDRKVTKEEDDLATTLRGALRMDPARAQSIDDTIASLVRDADAVR